MAKANRTSRRLKAFRGILGGAKSLLIVMQDHPDPDAVAAAGALRHIANSVAGVSCSLAHGGAIRRAENRALVRYLGLNLRPMEEVNTAQFDLVAMVDTQPATGNNSLPDDARVDIVVDHHPMRKATRASRFTDVRRDYGATSTIFYEYLTALKLQPDAPLATALCYGIQSDTQDLGRDTVPADIAAYIALYPLANRRMLGGIRRAPEPAYYFRILARGLSRARIYGRCVLAPLGQVEAPETVAEVAELLLRHEGIDWSLAYGVFKKRICLSLRTEDTETDAAKVMRAIVSRIGSGGGHPRAAGGQIPLDASNPAARKRIEDFILKRFLRRLGVKDATGKTLLARD